MEKKRKAKTRVGKVFVGAYVKPSLAKELKTSARESNITLDRFVANILEFVIESLKKNKALK